MKKFIFSLTEGVQVIIEAEGLAQARQEYDKLREEAASIKIDLIKRPVRKPIKKGLYENLLDLKEQEFFSVPRTLGQIKEKLSELTLHYPITSFPTYLNRLIRDGVLKRYKGKKDNKEIWFYIELKNE